MIEQHKKLVTFPGTLLRVCIVLFTGLTQGSVADTALDRLYTVLREHSISFDTNAVTETAVETAIKKIDTGARLIKAGQASVSVPAPTILQREDWAESIGYLKLAGMFEEGRKQILACLEEWARQGRQGIILDLRGAGGYDLESVDQLAGFFSSTETNLYQIVDGSGQVLETRRTLRNETSSRSRMILIILVDGATTGASELLAAVLQSTGGVLVVGSRTAGDNALREAVPLWDDRALYIATRRLMVLKALDYNKGQGVCPDIQISNLSRRGTATNSIPPRLDRRPSVKAQRDFQLMQRVAEDHVLGRAVDILLALTALEHNESWGATNSIDAARL